MQEPSVTHAITQMSWEMHATTQLLFVQLTKCQEDYIQQFKCYSCNKTYLFLLPSWISTPYLSHEITKISTLCHLKVFLLKMASIYVFHQPQPSLFLLDPLLPPLLCSLSANPMTLWTMHLYFSFLNQQILLWLSQHLDSHHHLVHLHDPLLRPQTFCCWQSQLAVKSITCGLKSIFSFLPIQYCSLSF